MGLWVLGFIFDEAQGDEATNWFFEGIFLSREDAIRAFKNIKTPDPESYFVAPVKVGELLFEDIMQIPGFEYIGKKWHLNKLLDLDNACIPIKKVIQF